MELSKLSNELLLEIFSLLDSKSLKNASLVCKTWSELIGSSAVTMKKFKLIIHPCSMGFLTEEYEKSLHSRSNSEYKLLNFHRKHFNVNLHFGEKFDEMSEKLERFDVSQARIVFFYATGFELGKLLKVLEKMPLLDDLDLHPEKILPLNEDLKCIVLPKLQKITVDSVYSTVLRFIKANQLAVFHSIGYRTPAEDEINSLNRFLMSTEQLEELEINSTCFLSFFRTEQKFPFKLRKFIMDQPCEVPGDVAINFNKFLLSQLESLKSLCLIYCTNLPCSTFDVIFNRLKKLESLTMDASSIPKTRSFYNNIQPSQSLKEIKLWNDFPDQEYFAGFLRNCPQLERLKIMKATMCDEINLIAAYNQQLRDLKIETLAITPAVDSIFNNLKSFTVSEIIDIDAWIGLIANSPAIEKIDIRYSLDEDQIDEAVIDFLLQQPSLRHLIFRGYYDDILRIFNKIKLNYGKFKTLDLTMNNSRDEDVVTVISANIKFEFPEDPSEWIVEEREKDFDEAWRNAEP